MSFKGSNMTKQDEKREHAIIDLMNYKGFHRAPAEKIVDCVLQSLDLEGVAIKVEDSPQTGWFWKNCKQQRSKPAKICLECPFVDCETGKLKVGFSKFEPLIKAFE